MLPAEVHGRPERGERRQPTAIMGAPLREAREISSANICASRSALFRQYLAHRRPSSAWNVRRCTGSSSRSASARARKRRLIAHAVIWTWARSVPRLSIHGRRPAHDADAGTRRMRARPAKNGVIKWPKGNTPSGHLSECAPQDQDAGDDVPRQRREAAGNRHLVRQFLGPAAPRRPVATRLQARHLDDHAGRPDRPCCTIERPANDEASSRARRKSSSTRVREARSPVTMFLVNGVMLQGGLRPSTCSACCCSAKDMAQLVYKTRGLDDPAGASTQPGRRSSEIIDED